MYDCLSDNLLTLHIGVFTFYIMMIWLVPFVVASGSYKCNKICHANQYHLMAYLRVKCTQGMLVCSNELQYERR